MKTKIANHQIAFATVKSLLSNTTLSEIETLVAINNAVSAFTATGAKLSTPQTKLIQDELNKISVKNGFCSNCRRHKLEKKSDTTCTFCKRMIRDACKKDLQKNFFSL